MSVNPQSPAPPSELESAVQATRAFKKSMAIGRLPYGVPVKGYFLPKDSIQQLLEQNGGDTTGLKMYFAERLNAEGKEVLELVVVATCRGYDGKDYSDEVDYNIPAADDPQQSNLESNPNVIFGAVRPCPRQCGSINVLNSDV